MKLVQLNWNSSGAQADCFHRCNSFKQALWDYQRPDYWERELLSLTNLNCIMRTKPVWQFNITLKSYFLIFNSYFIIQFEDLQIKITWPLCDTCSWCESGLILAVVRSPCLSILSSHSKTGSAQIQSVTCSSWWKRHAYSWTFFQSLHRGPTNNQCHHLKTTRQGTHTSIQHIKHRFVKCFLLMKLWDLLYYHFQSYFWSIWPVAHDWFILKVSEEFLQTVQIVWREEDVNHVSIPVMSLLYAV